LTAAASITVEVCEARADGSTRIALTLPVGSTVDDAIVASGVVERLSFDRATSGVGVFGRRVPLTTVLHDGDRVELYRPLIVDPMDARRRRAALRR
jgi:uncharacterized protein